MHLDPTADLGTHDVLNQPADPGDRDLWRDDPLLRAMLAAGGAPLEGLARYGALLGRAGMRDAARDANRHPPELVLFDSGGRRLDELRFHPAWHRFMQDSIAAGYHSVAWEGGPAGHLTHAAMVYLASQVEPGHCCPLTMTYAAVPVISAAGDLPGDWRAALLSRRYDPAVRPLAAKQGATLGMAMTEKQGGSDVRANTTRAEPDGAAWRLTGHKWFCSAPMSDGFLTLAQTGRGLTCFLVPRWLEEGRNAIRIQRLKDKLGNRSNGSAEIEYQRALAWRIGEEGDGIRTIVEMVHHTRLDTAMAPAGLMRAALREAHHWAACRSAFQRRLIDQPLMRAVLADLVLDWQGCLALGLHVAASFDGRGAEDRAFARIGVALAKYLSNKLCPQVVAEAMEVLGGMGYVEDTPLPMLYREAPLNGIWEGSGNVICLDALRTLAREPLAAEMLAARLDAAKGLEPAYDAALAAHRECWGGGVPEAEARWFAERSALLLTAAVLLAHGDADLAGAFVRTRLGAERGRTPGTIPATLAERILARGFPVAE
ncbi:acyl-CoA dehydrogenase family protein [Paracoccus denitrificans]|jgi:putative acyl-CoA dehydrogenase|uniref:Acyl-CoA dehydrogenase domain protein n=1 Tax=Paracoccus denitrificans (strain Pd 1222) TaxID=318586 RepID=A1B0L5_PARDP|nr:acyl-CoA dehydrogenase family protein [Paracoccus denitrificans]ABL69059.1 acyl-CoA dehydrogenase domain protein [Paracoccus denitrificans PD1222]MBB4630013.1 putative acyl-CoA dehydrogenase [Paracoccus denitrificans]MCU7431554.1 acyl-CoA dehydrogenase family protein [Paracoccus denitrificans]QAR27092.1 DNA alkylation response protein [Paracoccus denitrificans]UPV96054.1 acyl-CoA dehydrogenase family protein [Paracoccus denitrificans]